MLPLWHGTEHADSICTSGFTFFGKHHLHPSKLFPVNVPKMESTDIGYFGSGIYFTNSAHYASIYSNGSLFLAWVSMREPYPVVNDVPLPGKGSDMQKLEGQGAYQNYNAHYIPVASVDPKNPKCMVYYPCYKSAQAAWDEYVVFHGSQTLPRFRVELSVDLPTAPSSLPTIQLFLKQIKTLLEAPKIKQDQEVYPLLLQRVEMLNTLEDTLPLSEEDRRFYESSLKLVDDAGGVSIRVKQSLKVIFSSFAKIPKKERAAAKPDEAASTKKRVNLLNFLTAALFLKQVPLT